jgi:uncharacterized SAM-binding protein YcdF (DUF218 family)
VLTALALPPVPFLLAVLVGAALVRRRRWLGWGLVLVSAAGIWLASTVGAAQAVSRWWLEPPPAMGFDRMRELKAAGPDSGTAIVVLGGGLESFAPEYGVGNLTEQSLERLRYGLWLSKQTGLPVAFAGGVGWAQRGQDQSEARVAARIAAEEFGRPLRWVEDRSRDTRENAERSVALLQPEKIRHVVVVTHGWHMPRALRAFAEAAPDWRVEPAPMGLADGSLRGDLEWMPSGRGFRQMRQALVEIAGRWAGA